MIKAVYLSNVLRQAIGYDGDQLRISIDMAYLPTLSVNRYKTARGITRREVQTWMSDLEWTIKATLQSQKVTLQPPITVGVEGFFEDRRHPDLSNLHKVICDGVKQGLGIDDKHFRVEDGEVRISPEPKLRITIRGRR